jgi:DNA-binding beta-propeller fold protein YncE
MSRAPVPPPASTRPRAVVARALGLAALAAFGCSLSQNGVSPPGDTFFYPTGAIMNPTDWAGDWLYVANSNADLRFNDGTLVMVNVGMRTDLGTMSGAAFDRTQPWPQCPQEDYVNPLPRSDAPICCRDLLDSNIINCDERRYVAADATVAIGSFAAGVAWQPFCNIDGLFQDPDPTTQACLKDSQGNPVESAGRLLIGVRGDTSLTDVDVVPAGPQGTPYENESPHPAFHCTADDRRLTPTLAECDQKVQEAVPTLNVVRDDTSTAKVNLPDEPYALALDPTQGFLYVGHLVGNTSTQDSGGVSLFDASGVGEVAAPTFPRPPKFIAPFGSPFPANSAGQYGITNLHMLPSLGSPSNSNKKIYASSRYVPLVTSMLVIGPSPLNSASQDNVVIPVGDTLNSGLSGSEMRGVEFIAPNNDLDAPVQRAFTLQRVPPALVGFDVAQTQSGATTAIPTDVTETCSSPTFLYQYPEPGHAGPDNPSRLFVNCFDTGEIYVFDPAVSTLITTFIVGRGPAGMVFDGPNAVAYVLNFTQNNVVVVDLAPQSPTQYHVVQRLGFPTVTPR